MKSLGFTIWGEHASIPLPDTFEQITQLEVRAGVMAVTNGDGSGPQARLTLSPQNFAIPYGELVMDAIKDLVFVPGGAQDLGGWLNVLIDCQSIAMSLGDVCVLGECVSDVVSIADMAGFCKSGLNIVGFVVESEVRSLKIELADLQNGRCSMYDK